MKIVIFSVLFFVLNIPSIFCQHSKDNREVDIEHFIIDFFQNSEQFKITIDNGNNCAKEMFVLAIYVDTIGKVSNIMLFKNSDSLGPAFDILRHLNAEYFRNWESTAYVNKLILIPVEIECKVIPGLNVVGKTKVVDFFKYFRKELNGENLVLRRCLTLGWNERIQ